MFLKHETSLVELVEDAHESFPVVRDPYIAKKYDEARLNGPKPLLASRDARIEREPQDLD
jgi:hypothetical protein